MNIDGIVIMRKCDNQGNMILSVDDIEIVITRNKPPPEHVLTPIIIIDNKIRLAVPYPPL